MKYMAEFMGNPTQPLVKTRPAMKFVRKAGNWLTNKETLGNLATGGLYGIGYGGLGYAMSSPQQREDAKENWIGETVKNAAGGALAGTGAYAISRLTKK